MRAWFSGRIPGCQPGGESSILSARIILVSMRDQKAINEKISIALLRGKRYTCRTCGNPSSRKLGGTVIFCKEHKKKHKNKIFEQCETTASRKRFLIREQGHRCWECNLTEWRGKPIPLQMDHVDGDPSNDKKENLRILCANCHAQTETFCGKNIGKKEFKRSRMRV